MNFDYINGKNKKFRDAFALSYTQDRMIMKINEISKIILSQTSVFSPLKNLMLLHFMFHMFPQFSNAKLHWKRVRDKLNDLERG